MKVDRSLDVLAIPDYDLELGLLDGGEVILLGVHLGGADELLLPGRGLYDGDRLLLPVLVDDLGVDDALRGGLAVN